MVERTTAVPGGQDGTRRPLTITFVVSELRYSGGVRCIVEYANRLAARGHRVNVVTSAAEGYLAEVALSATVRLVSLPLPLNRRSAFANLRLVAAFLRAMPSSDIVVATHVPTVPVAQVAARILRKGRAVWFCQDFPEQFQSRPLLKAIYRFASPLFARVLCISTSAAEDLPRTWPKGPGHRLVVGEGLSDAALLWPGAFEARDPLEVAFIGDDRPRKGLGDLLAALTLVAGELPGIRLSVVSLADLAPFLSARATVPYTLTRNPERGRLADLLRRCAVFASPSWAESFGLPPLEAMACAAPVIVTDSRGGRTFARHEENCLVVAPREPAALAAALLRLLKDRDLAARLAAEGPKTAAAFTWDECVDRFEEGLYAALGRSEPKVRTR